MSISSCSRNRGSRASMDIPSMASRRDVGINHGGNGKTEVTSVRVSTTEENSTARGVEIQWVGSPRVVQKRIDSRLLVSMNVTVSASHKEIP